MYVLQDVWINMIKHKDKKKNGEDVTDVSIGWKSQDHIIREQNEAIAALYKLGINIRDIGKIVEVTDRTVTTWKNENLECARVRRCRKNVKKPITFKDYKKVTEIQKKKN